MSSPRAQCEGALYFKNLNMIVKRAGLLLQGYLVSSVQLRILR